jgi:hypothetical protein
VVGATPHGRQHDPERDGLTPDEHQPGAVLRVLPARLGYVSAGDGLNPDHGQFGDEPVAEVSGPDQVAA